MIISPLSPSFCFNMDRLRLLLIGLPIFLLCADILNSITRSPPPTHHHRHDRPYNYPQSIYQPKSQQKFLQEPLPFPTQQKPITNIGEIGLGSTVYIAFCTSSSYNGIAFTMKNMLEAAYPGLNVMLVNYPPSFPKEVLSKVVPVVQVGIIGTIIAGEQIFTMLGLMRPPPWYCSLRTIKIASIAGVCFFGNALLSSLKTTGAFEVYCNDEFVFSKLKEGRFPAELELKDLVGRKLRTS